MRILRHILRWEIRVECGERGMEHGIVGRGFTGPVRGLNHTTSFRTNETRDR